jgi:glutamine cyclotransferase
MRKGFVLIVFWFILGFSSCNDDPPEEPEVPVFEFDFEVNKIFGHGTDVFTQGLVFHNGRLLESTGREGSFIAEVDLIFTDYDKKVILDDSLYGEGITVFNDRIYQLTWRNQVGFIYDANTYEKIGQFNYDYEGWGITHDSVNLIVSTGSPTIHFLDPNDQTIRRTINVTLNGEPVSNINELEYAYGLIFANQFLTENILLIDPVTGAVVQVLDMFDLFIDSQQQFPDLDFFNGIAYLPDEDVFYFTGRLWPFLYEVRISQQQVN